MRRSGKQLPDADVDGPVQPDPAIAASGIDAMLPVTEQAHGMAIDISHLEQIVRIEAHLGPEQQWLLTLLRQTSKARSVMSGGDGEAERTLAE